MSLLALVVGVVLLWWSVRGGIGTPEFNRPAVFHRNAGCLFNGIVLLGALGLIGWAVMQMVNSG